MTSEEKDFGGAKKDVREESEENGKDEKGAASKEAVEEEEATGGPVKESGAGDNER